MKKNVFKVRTSFINQYQKIALHIARTGEVKLMKLTGGDWQEEGESNTCKAKTSSDNTAMKISIKI